MSRNPPKTGSQPVLPYRLPSTVIPTGPGNLWIRLIIIVQLTEANLPRGNSEFYCQTEIRPASEPGERGNVLKASLEYYDTVKIRGALGLETVPVVQPSSDLSTSYNERHGRVDVHRCFLAHARCFDVVSFAFVKKKKKRSNEKSLYDVVYSWMAGLKLGLILREKIYIYIYRGCSRIYCPTFFFLVKW